MNSRDKRKLRRMLQEAGLTQPQPTPATTPAAKKQDPLWKRVPHWIYFLLGVCAIAVTLLEGFASFSFQESALLDPSNPFSQMFTTSYEGYWPITDIDISCTPQYVTEHYNLHLGNVQVYQHITSYMTHSDQLTIPCFMGDRDAKVRNDFVTRLDVAIAFSFFPAKWRVLRKSKTFHFLCTRDKSNQPHWIFAGN
jgi:hypothetical protein